MPPRILPGSRRDLGLVTWAIARVAGLATGGPPPNLFTTLGRHHSFVRWLPFAGSLMPRGKLPRDEGELVILRVAHLCDQPYEWSYHERIALTAGLSREDVERVRSGPEADGWTPRQALLLRAVDALHADRDIGDDLWAELEAELGDPERLIELCLLTGHYEMLAMVLNACRVEPDPPLSSRGRGLARLASSRGRSRPSRSPSP